MLSISLYYISIVTEFTTYCTWYYIYTGCYTLYLRNFHFPARPSERGLVREKRRTAKRVGGRGKDRYSRVNEGSVNSIQHARCWYTYISLSLRRQVSISPRQLFGAESLLRKIVTMTVTTDKTERDLTRKGLVWRRVRTSGLVEAWKPGPTEFIASPPWTRTNDRTMNPASWQTTKCRCFFEVAGGPKVD